MVGYLANSKEITKPGHGLEEAKGLWKYFGEIRTHFGVPRIRPSIPRFNRASKMYNIMP